MSDTAAVAWDDQLLQNPHAVADKRRRVQQMFAAIAPSYADVQPFHEGVAWVRRPEAETWELIDESGEQLLGEPEHGGPSENLTRRIQRAEPGHELALHKQDA